jgi:hypothetical protein
LSLPILPHCDLDPECCGYLLEVVEETGTRFVCNECGAVVPKEDVARLLLEMESCEATYPHCGKINRIEGFSELSAFRCQYCGEGVRV